MEEKVWEGDERVVTKDTRDSHVVHRLVYKGGSIKVKADMLVW